MAEQYTLTRNGTKQAVLAEPGTTLVTILRRNFGLLGTKQGCDNGVCGACTVVVNGKAVKSCVQPDEEVPLHLTTIVKDITTKLDNIIKGYENRGTEEVDVEHIQDLVEQTVRWDRWA